MAERKTVEASQSIADKIKMHLQGSAYGNFILNDMPITMYTGNATRNLFGKEFGLNIHSPIPDSQLHSSHGIVIVTFSRNRFRSPVVRETLGATTLQDNNFVETWKGRFNFDGLSMNKRRGKLKIQPDLTEFAEILDNKDLQRVENDGPSSLVQERILSENIWNSAKSLYTSAVDTANDYRQVGGHDPVDEYYIAKYKIGEIEAKIQYIPSKKKKFVSAYWIDFRPGEDAPWERYTIDQEYTFLRDITKEQGRISFRRPSEEKKAQLASTLGQFDINDLIL